MMKCEKNPLTGDWLCWIPNTPQAYYYSTEKQAMLFVIAVNRAFERGELIIKNGNVERESLFQSDT